MRTRTRGVVYETDAARLESLKRGRDVVDAKGDVVKARTAFLEVPRDWRARVGRFQQFEGRPAGGNEMRADFLGRDVFWRLDVEAQRVAIERQRLVEVRDGNADVVESCFHSCRFRLQAKHL